MSTLSAPTMLDLHDAQMSDYPGDIDVPMHSSTSEYWFHSEVTMEDDGHHLHMPKASHLEHETTTVEVDMEPYGGEREDIEYEMADEAGVYTFENGDVEDVDLYDASHVHTPAAVFQTDATNTPQIAATNDAHSSSILLANSLTSAVMTMGDMHEAEHTTYEGEPGDGNHDSTLEVPVAPSPRLDTHLGDGVVHVEESALHSDGQPAQGDVSRAALRPVESAGVPINSNTETSPDTTRNVHADEEVDKQADTSLLSEAYIVVPVVTQPPQSVESVDHIDYKEPGAYPDEEHRGASADPHEISEGVYIDPPPAVLLTLPSSDQTEVCLFNRPRSSSSATIPSPEGAENTQQTLMLLLHHRPTLYYEPLVSVFDALRQEEYIAQIPGISDGELVLDAYDLHLTLSEDNVYAREVTLHDLNVIHDGTDMSGPLRLQLQSVIPRFIFRYHSLRDQIARLNLATEGGEDREVASEEEHNREENLEHAQEQIQHADHDDHQEQQLLEVQETYRGETTESLENSSEATGDNPNFNNEAHGAEGEVTDTLGNHEAGNEGVHHSEEELEYTDADDGVRFDLEDASDGLDADATHDVADTYVLAPISVEYEQYAEPQDEDDGARDEAHSEDPVDRQALGHTKSENGGRTTVDETYPHALRDFESFVGAEGETTYPLRERSETSAEDDDGNVGVPHNVITFRPEEVAIDVIDRNSQATELLELEVQNVVDESDSHSVTVLESEQNIADPLLDSNNAEHPIQQDINPEPYDEEWDDSLDGEGEPDINWEAEYDDLVSNESSITLSSNTSKRRHDEVDSEGDRALLFGSPGLKRPRVE